MLYEIKLISLEVENFKRILQIDSEATFLDLNKLILDSCGYSDDQLTSFFLCDEEWRRGVEVTREDMGTSAADVDVYIMESTPLSELIEDEEQRLEFVFDPFSERTFVMEVTSLIPGKSLSEGICVLKQGEAPTQLQDMDFGLDNIIPTVKKGGGDDFDGDADFFGDDSFNADEFDAEGFEISDEY